MNLTSETTPSPSTTWTRQVSVAAHLGRMIPNNYHRLWQCIGSNSSTLHHLAVKQLNHSWTKHEVSGSCYGVSDKGWVDQGLFHHWLKVHFLVNAVSRRPLLLLLDGHSSHFEPQSIEFAKENGVVIFRLPPHTTHECQLLDVGLFGPLKKHWQ